MVGVLCRLWNGSGRPFGRRSRCHGDDNTDQKLNTSWPKSAIPQNKQTHKNDSVRINLFMFWKMGHLKLYFTQPPSLQSFFDTFLYSLFSTMAFQNLVEYISCWNKVFLEYYTHLTYSYSKILQIVKGCILHSA